MKFVTLIGSWYVNTVQYAKLGYDESLESLYVINADHIDYIEKDKCASEPTYWIIKLSEALAL